MPALLASCLINRLVHGLMHGGTLPRQLHESVTGCLGKGPFVLQGQCIHRKGLLVMQVQCRRLPGLLQPRF